MNQARTRIHRRPIQLVIGVSWAYTTTVDHLPKALYGLTLYHMDSGRHRAALQVAQRLLDADRADSEVLVLAHRLIGTCQLYLGNFGETRRHCEAGLRLYDPMRHDRMRFTYAQDQKISLQVRLSRALLALGYPLQALRHARAALSRLRRLGHPHTRAFAIHTLAYVFRDLRAERLLRLLGRVLLDLAERHDFRAHRAGGLFALGAAALLREEHGVACDLLERSLEAYREAHARYLISLVMGDLAATEGALGHGQKAQALLDEALRMVERNEERCLEAPLRQIAGGLMRDQDAGAAIEQLRCALEVARGQGARWFELRAARDLAHLLAAQGNRQSAHNLLAPVYLGFAEGLGAPDLKEAKALLTKLAGAGRKARYPEGRV